MDGTTLIGETFLKSAYSDWQVATTADLNGDGKIDIVWQHPDSGQMYAWMMERHHGREPGVDDSHRRRPQLEGCRIV